MRSERRSCRDVTDQQASRGGCKAADSCYASLRHQFRTDTYQHERVLDERLDFVFRLHQPRRQLLHLPGREQGIQERDKNYGKRHIKESATWKRKENICAVMVQV